MEIDTYFINDLSAAPNTSLSGCLSYNTIRDKIISGEYKISKATGKSKVWEVYGVVIDEGNEQIPNIVACQTCLNIFKHCSKATSNLLKHKCFKNYLRNGRKANNNSIKQVVETSVKAAGIEREALDAISAWMVNNCRTHKIIENLDYDKLLKCIAPLRVTYGQHINLQTLLPDTCKISKNIENIYEKYFNELKNELAGVKPYGYALTTDLWSDKYLGKTYLALTVHYIKNGNISNKLLGLRAMAGERNTCANLLYIKVAEILKEFELTLDEKVIIVSGCEANMVAAFRSNTHLHCMLHSLHNVLQRSIEETALIAKLSRACLKLMKFLKKSTHNSTIGDTVKSYSPTSYTAMYDLLSSLQSNWQQIYDILQQENQLEKIKDIPLPVLHGTTAILEPFAQAFKQLEHFDNKSCVTAQLSYVFVHRLQKVCAIAAANDAEEIVEFKSNLCKYLKSIVFENLNILHKIALFLFAPANKLLPFSEYDKTCTKTACKCLMAEYKENTLLAVAATPSCSTANSLLFMDFVQTSHHHATLSFENKIDNELAKYESTDVDFYDDFDILQWWTDHRNDFPILYKLSCRVLATPASAAPARRALAVARNLITDKNRSFCCNDSVINKIMFMHGNRD